jgi:hypothetical protein
LPTKYITEMVLRLVNSKQPFITSKKYYDDKSYLNKCIKNNDARLVVISRNDNRSIDQMVNHFINLGVKNIIVNDCFRDDLRFDNFELYLQEINEELLLENPNCTHPNYCIFSSNQQLDFNFLLWCCSS